MFLKFVFFVFVFWASTSAQAVATGGAPDENAKPKPKPVAKPKTEPECSCVPAGMCGSNIIIGFDVRIVNKEKKKDKCPGGHEWCCEGSVRSNVCGIRKITDSPRQPHGIATYASYPWQAALLDEKNVYFGSGVLLNQNYVLTAAHKIVPFLTSRIREKYFNTKIGKILGYHPLNVILGLMKKLCRRNGNFKVRLGDWDIIGPKDEEPYPVQDFQPAKITIHPGFMMSNLQNDVAIIKLNKPVPLVTSPNINCAPMAEAVPKPGTRCWLAGWGKDDFGPSGNYQTVMREVDVPIVDQETCEAQMRTTRLGAFFTLDKTSFMCAGGEGGKDACTDDGGAPLVCPSATGRFEIVGMVAWGIGCSITDVPGVYVNVPNYRAWINQQMA